MHISLYRKYRPMRFSEVIGQSAATDLLRTAFAERTLSHAYLLSGPRGCGKTTAARLVAKVVNCSAPSSDGEPCCECSSCRAVVSGDHMDVMEIDGASSRGIDQIRELKSHVGLSSFMGGSKVYILDEVHMLTMEAFNALLKTLEEPPSSVLFLFATTEPHKVPVTIRSRCQHIPFHRITTADIVSQLSFIAEREGVETEESALWEIARNADGALRDAISLFEQALASGSGRVGADSVKGLFGGAARCELEGWLSLLRTDPASASAMLKETLDKGVSHERFLESLFPLLKDMWVYSLWGERAFTGLALSAEERAFLINEAPQWGSETLARMNRVCASLFPRARFGQRAEVFFGLLLFELLGAMEPPASGSSVQVRAESRPSSQIAGRPVAKPINAQIRDSLINPGDERSGSSADRSDIEDRRSQGVYKGQDDSKTLTAPPVKEISAPVQVRAASVKGESEIKKTKSNETGASSGQTAAPVKRVVQTQAVGRQAGDREGLSELPHPLLTALWGEDLLLCAALLDVKVSMVDSKPNFDYSEALELAKVVIEAPRARRTLSGALSVLGGGADISAAETDTEEAGNLGDMEISPFDDHSDIYEEAAAKSTQVRNGGEPSGARAPRGAGPEATVSGSPAPARRRVSESEMSLKELSAYIGADILVERSVSTEPAESDITESVETDS